MVASPPPSIPGRSNPMTSSRDFTWLSAPAGAALGYVPALLAFALIVYAIVAGGYFVALAGFALIYAIFVTGLNIFMGYAGQASFGQNAFAAIGGYTSAGLTTAYGGAPVPALGIGGFEAVSDREQLVLLSVLVALCMVSAWLIRHSRFGRALVALSGSEDAARALG